LALVAFNYRWSPKAKNPAYIEDAAEAVAWTFRNGTKQKEKEKTILFHGFILFHS